MSLGLQRSKPKQHSSYSWFGSANKLLKDIEDKQRDFELEEEIKNEDYKLSEENVNEELPLQQNIEFEKSGNDVVHQFIDNMEFESNSFPSQEPESMRE